MPHTPNLADSRELLRMGTFDEFQTALKVIRTNQERRDQADLVTHREVHRQEQMHTDQLQAEWDRASGQRKIAQATLDNQQRCRKDDTVIRLQDRHDLMRWHQQSMRTQQEADELSERQHDSRQYWNATQQMMGTLADEQKQGWMVMHHERHAHDQEAAHRRRCARQEQEQQDRLERFHDYHLADQFLAGDHARQCIDRQYRADEVHQEFLAMQYFETLHREQQQRVTEEAEALRVHAMHVRARQESRDMDAFLSNRQSLLQARDASQFKRQRIHSTTKASQATTDVYTNRAHRHTVCMEATPTRQQVAVPAEPCDDQALTATLEQRATLAAEQHTNHVAELMNQLQAVENTQAILKQLPLHDRDEAELSDRQTSSLAPCRDDGRKVQITISWSDTGYHYYSSSLHHTAHHFSLLLITVHYYSSLLSIIQ
jgi:hypothetical protein